MRLACQKGCCTQLCLVDVPRAGNGPEEQDACTTGPSAHVRRQACVTAHQTVDVTEDRLVKATP